jgi:predicted AlkP superfamily pyrophosphatase or phosphodiesterase
VQHKHAAGDKEADDFMMALDTSIGRLAELGAIVAVTGDHGMSDKSEQTARRTSSFYRMC